METEKIIQILQGVQELTNQHKLLWEIDNSAMTHVSYTVKVEPYKILIYTSALSSILVILNNENREVGRLTEAFWSTHNDQVGSLIKQVKEQIEGKDKDLDNLFDALNKKKEDS